MKPNTFRTKKLQRVRAHQCPTCRTYWSLRVVDHPAGRVVVCTHCGEVTRGAPRWRASAG